MILYFLFFLLGVTFTKAFYFILNFGYSINLMKRAELASLLMLVEAAEDVSFTKEMKYLSMKDAEFPENKITAIKSIDDKTIENWKRSTIQSLINLYPNFYEAKYHDWKSALEHLDKVWKKS